MFRFFFAVIALTLIPLAAYAEDFDAILKRVSELRQQGKYTEALNELNWATEELQKGHMEKLKSFFPKEVAGFTAGEFKANNAMGLLMLERHYKSADGKNIKLSLTGTASTQGAGAKGFGALAGMAQMAAAFDGNTEAVRVGGMRAQVTNTNGKPSLFMSLNSGMMFQVEPTSGTVPQEQLVSLAEKVDFNGLNTYLGTTN